MPQQQDGDVLWRVDLNLHVTVWATTEKEAVNLAVASTHNWHDWDTDQVGRAVRIPHIEDES